MSDILAPSSKLVTELLDAGLIPANCFIWSLVFKAGQPPVIASHVYVTEDQFRKLTDVLKRNTEELQREAITLAHSIGREHSAEPLCFPGPASHISKVTNDLPKEP